MAAQPAGSEGSITPKAGGLKITLKRNNDNWSLSPTNNPLKICLRLGKSGSKVSEEDSYSSTHADVDSYTAIRPQTVRNLTDFKSEDSESEADEDVFMEGTGAYTTYGLGDPETRVVPEVVEDDDDDNNDDDDDEDPEEDETDSNDDQDEYKPPAHLAKDIHRLSKVIPKIKIKPICPATGDTNSRSPRTYQVSPARADGEQELPRRVLRERKDKSEAGGVRRSPRIRESESEPQDTEVGHSPRTASLSGQSQATLLSDTKLNVTLFRENRSRNAEQAQVPRVPPLKLSSALLGDKHKEFMVCHIKANIKAQSGYTTNPKSQPAYTTNAKAQPGYTTKATEAKDWHASQAPSGGKMESEERGTDLSVSTVRHIDSSPENPIQPSPKDSGIDVSSPSRREEEAHMDFSPASLETKRPELHHSPEAVDPDRRKAAPTEPEATGSDHQDSAVEDDLIHVAENSCQLTRNMVNGHAQCAVSRYGLTDSSNHVISSLAKSDLRVPSNGQYMVNLVKDTKLKITTTAVSAGVRRPVIAPAQSAVPVQWSSATLSVTSTVVTDTTSSCLGDVQMSNSGCTLVCETVSQTVSPIAYRLGTASVTGPGITKHPHRKICLPPVDGELQLGLAPFTEPPLAPPPPDAPTAQALQPPLQLDVFEFTDSPGPNQTGKPGAGQRRGKRHRSLVDDRAINPAKKPRSPVKRPNFGPKWLGKGLRSHSEAGDGLRKSESEHSQSGEDSNKKSPRSLSDSTPKLLKKPDSRSGGLSAVRRAFLEVAATIGRKPPPPPTQPDTPPVKTSPSEPQQPPKDSQLTGSRTSSNSHHGNQEYNGNLGNLGNTSSHGSQKNTSYHGNQGKPVNHVNGIAKGGNVRLPRNTKLAGTDSALALTPCLNSSPTSLRPRHPSLNSQDPSPVGPTQTDRGSQRQGVKPSHTQNGLNQGQMAGPDKLGHPGKDPSQGAEVNSPGSLDNNGRKLHPEKCSHQGRTNSNTVSSYKHSISQPDRSPTQTAYVNQSPQNISLLENSSVKERKCLSIERSSDVRCTRTPEKAHPGHLKCSQKQQELPFSEKAFLDDKPSCPETSSEGTRQHRPAAELKAKPSPCKTDLGIKSCLKISHDQSAIKCAAENRSEISKNSDNSVLDLLSGQPTRVLDRPGEPAVSPVRPEEWSVRVLNQPGQRPASPVSPDDWPVFMSQDKDTTDKTDCKKNPVEPMGYKQKLLGSVYRITGPNNGSAKSPNKSPVKKRARLGSASLSFDASQASQAAHASHSSSVGSLSPPNIVSSSPLPLPAVPHSQLMKLSDSTESFGAPPELFAEPQHVGNRTEKIKASGEINPDSPDCSTIDPVTGLCTQLDSVDGSTCSNTESRTTTPTPPPPSAFLNEFTKFLKQSQKQNVVLPQKRTRAACRLSPSPGAGQSDCSKVTRSHSPRSNRMQSPVCGSGQDMRITRGNSPRSSCRLSPVSVSGQPEVRITRGHSPRSAVSPRTAISPARLASTQLDFKTIVDPEEEILALTVSSKPLEGEDSLPDIVSSPSSAPSTAHHRKPSSRSASKKSQGVKTEPGEVSYKEERKDSSVCREHGRRRTVSHGSNRGDRSRSASRNSNPGYQPSEAGDSVASIDSESQYNLRKIRKQKVHFDSICDCCFHSDVELDVSSDAEPDTARGLVEFNADTFIRQQERVVYLRRRVVELLHVLFPEVMSAASVSADTPQVEALMDQVMGAACESVAPPTTQVLLTSYEGFEDEKFDLGVVVCKSPRHCLVSLQRKVVRLLLTLLPELVLENNFQCHTDRVEDLLMEVITTNGNECDKQTGKSNTTSQGDQSPVRTDSGEQTQTDVQNDIQTSGDKRSALSKLSEFLAFSPAGSSQDSDWPNVAGLEYDSSDSD